jgi:uncharacterized protein
MRKWLAALFKSDEENKPDGATEGVNKYETAAGIVLAVVVLFLFLLTNEAMRKHALKQKIAAASGINALAGAASPYLLESSHSPIQWHQWGRLALEEAKKKNLPVLVFSGHMSHWCDTMDREVFSDLDLAARLNRTFVCIKIDRDDRPDIDAACQDALQVLGQTPGWPALVWLTPDLQPFHAGKFSTVPELKGLAEDIEKTWISEPGKLTAKAAKIAADIAGLETHIPQEANGLKAFTASLRDAAITREDNKNGGIASLYKLPHLSVLRAVIATQDKEFALNYCSSAARGFLTGSLRDQVRGGYFHASLAEDWSKPEFEKDLEDQAQFALFYFDLADLCDEVKPGSGRIWRAEGEAVVTFVLNAMKPDSSPGYSQALATDLAGEDGASYQWSSQDIREVLPEQEAHAWCAAFGIPESIIEARKAHTPYRAMGYDASVYAHVSEATKSLAGSAHGRKLPRQNSLKSVVGNGWMLIALLRCYRETHSVNYLNSAREQSAFLASLVTNGTIARYSASGKLAGTGQLAEAAMYVRAMAAMAAVESRPQYTQSARAFGELLLRAINNASFAKVQMFPVEDAPLDSRPLLNSLSIDETGSSPAALAVDALMDLIEMPGTDTAHAALYRDAARSVRARYSKTCALDPLSHAALIRACERRGMH